MKFEKINKYWPEGVREKVLMRDGNKCFVCGVDAKIVHHIFHDVKFTEEKDLVTLCTKCHGEAHRNQAKKVWVYYFVKRLSEEYNYSYEDMIEGGEAEEIMILVRNNGIAAL